MKEMVNNREIRYTLYENRVSRSTGPITNQLRTMHNELLTSIENQTLAHFRHFSSLFTNFPSTTVVSALQIAHFMQNKPN
ncbi:MAG TPA: hypothetical protein HPP66_02100, partial [Planctomycetes bacterium]|nr:hypothetical protein [Planctomycetota bacterium]